MGSAEHGDDSIRLTELVSAQNDRFISIHRHPLIIRWMRASHLSLAGQFDQNGGMKKNLTSPARMPERVSNSDLAGLRQLLSDQVVAHLAFVFEGRAMVLPSAIALDGESILLHGSTGSWWMRQLATGIPVTASVASLDGLVYARSGFESSMIYRSAVLFGSCRRVTGPELETALDILVDRLLPGRAAELRGPTKKELAATLVLRMEVSEWTLKAANFWPDDPESDIAGDAWAGVLPIRSVYGQPLAAPDLREGIPLAGSVAKLAGKQAFLPKGPGVRLP